MRKRILIIITLILFLTGCSCTYNLTINGDKYSEEIILVGENNNEISSFNKNWQIPIDKNEYNIGTDPSSDNKTNSNTYKYTLYGSRITFNYDFGINEYINSTAVSKCYNKLTVINQEDNLIISSSSKAICFEQNPPLNNVTINITVDRPVKNSNADSKNGNTYTWRLNKNNANSKDINLILDNKTENDKKNSENTKDNSGKNIIPNSNTNLKKDYTMYIFAVILLIGLLGAYLIVNKVKNKEDNM